MTPEAENAAKLVVGGPVTISARMHYRDVQGQDHYLPLTDQTQTYDALQPKDLDANEFAPSSADIAQVPGYVLSTDTPTVVSGSAALGKPVSAKDDQSVLQFELVPKVQKALINYVDEDGKIIHTTTVNGQTDQTVEVPSEVPAGWKLVDGQKIPEEIAFGPEGHEDVTVKVEHQHVTVTPDKPQANGTKLPDNPAKTFTGVEASDLNKTITRTIKVTTPDGQTNTVTQTAKLTRTADVDEVTGDVTYGDWSTAEWPAYDVPSVPGYTPSQSNVAKETVTDATKDTTVAIAYTPNQHQINVEYVDDDAVGKIVKTDQVPGKTDQTITITPSAPTGYDLVDGSDRNYTVTSTDGQSVQIHVKHHQMTTTEDKTVTRTINVHTPHNGVWPVKQTAKLTRPVKVDQVTGDKVYGDWSTGWWNTVILPAFAGYTSSRREVPGINVIGDMSDEVLDVTYTADIQKVVINYLDDTNGGKVVKTDQVTGKTDATVKVTPTVPTGYELVGEVPSAYTITAQPDQVIAVHLIHQLKTTTENKTITRTINVHTPHDGVKTVTQTAKLTRPVTTDQVTDKKTYGDWSTDVWPEYTPEVVAGYTPDTKVVPKANVDGSADDQMVDVRYIADDQKVEISYLDDANGGKVVKTDQVTGKTDATIKVTPDVPTGYELVGKVPSEYTVMAQPGQTVEIHLTHQIKTTIENKTITRTIEVHTPHDGTKTIKQPTELSREVKTDQVTGAKTYGNWTAGQWDAYQVPTIQGYVPSVAQVAQQVVTGDLTDQTVTVTYSSGDQTTHVNYVDETGQTVYTTTINGQTDQTVKVPSEIPTGWKLVDGQNVPDTISFGPDGHADITVQIEHRHVMVTPDQPQSNGTKLPDNPTKTFSGVEAGDLNKTITRTIEDTTPDGKTTTVKQEAKLTRTANVDEVTGEVTYSDWTTGSWDAYDVPTVAGYTPSQSEVSATKVPDTTKDQTVTIGYTANDQTTHVNYVDNNGKTVHTTTITGKTDQTVKVPSEVPAGWIITDGQVPDEITFGPDGHAEVTITIGYQTVTVMPDQPKENGTQLPDNPAMTFEGVEHGDLNQTVTRTIEVTTPNGKTITTKQEAKLTRPATVDEVTGEVTYGAWTTGEWTAYDVPTVPGYTASQDEVPAIKVTDTTKDQTVPITYTADSQTTHINYVDDDDKPVHMTTITGKTGETVKVPSEVPAGWTIADGKVPSEITFGPDGHADVTITVDHQTIKVTSGQPKEDGTKLPDNPALTFHGVGEDDLNRTITRTITLQVPGRAPQVITQTVHLTREATVDEVTGAVTYGDWSTGTWDEYVVPSVEGYTVSTEVIPAVEVTSETTNQTVNVAYVVVPAKPATPAPDATPTKEAPAQSAGSIKPAEPKVATLPQTGEAQNVLAPIGLALLGTLASFGLFGRKKKEKESGK